MREALITVLVLTSSLVGCIGGTDEPVDPASDDERQAMFPACQHPYPCTDGSAWPSDLEGPFEIQDPVNVEVESFDGTTIHGVIWRPELPEGVEAPVVLEASPYFCQTGPCADDQRYLDVDAGYGDLIETGYAVALFNVRGTGHSGGCFDLTGLDARQDIVEVVNWLADQPWSNGRVGMYGISYMGTTPWLPAVEQVSALKTIVPMGIITNWYTEAYSPQGAVNTLHGEAHLANGLVQWGFTPGFDLGSADGWAENAPEKGCQDAVSSLTEIQKGAYTGVRDAEFWEERRFIDELPNVTAAVFVAHGLLDNGGHRYQEDTVWQSLSEDTPKRLLFGQWYHEYPTDNLEGGPFEGAWTDVLVDWLDFWLKGQGDPPRLGTVDYQADDGAWHRSDAWPPSEASDEVLYLHEAALASEASEGARSFLAHPASEPTASACRDLPDTPACPPPDALVYTSDAVDRSTLVAGNPMAYLTLEADQPGGIVTVDLLDVAPDAECLRIGCEGVAHLSAGTADLQFHQGGYEAEDFPVDEPVPVRIDLYNLAHVLDEGHRLGLVVSHGDVLDRHGQPYSPTITVHGADGPEASHVVLPVANGTLGGDAPTLDYPPRPFQPKEMHR